MTMSKQCLAITLLLGAAALPCGAASSAASSVSDSITTSVGSVSDSLRHSSDSSRDGRVAEGDYRILQVADVPERPGTLRLTLRPLAHAAAGAVQDEFMLYLPAQTVQQSRLAAGQDVRVHQRPYGVEFAKADASHEAFYLVLNDEWFKELQTNPVTL